MPQPKFSERLEYFMRRAEMSNRELARRLEVGPSAVTAWLKDVNTPTHDNPLKIVEVFEVDLATFFGPPTETAAPAQE